MKIYDNFIISKATTHKLLNFLIDKSKVVLELNGISGIGKSGVLSYVNTFIKGSFYFNSSFLDTPINIMGTIYHFYNKDKELLNEATAILNQTMYNYYNNMGNLTIQSSRFKNVNIHFQPEILINYKAEEHDKNILQNICTKIFSDNMGKSSLKLIIILDQFELSQNNLSIINWLQQIISSLSNIKIIISSNTKFQRTIVDDEKLISVLCSELSLEETNSYLIKRGIVFDDVRRRFYNFSKGHPLILKMMSDIYSNNSNIDYSITKASNEVIVSYLIKRVKETLPIELREVFYYLPLCRFFEPRLISQVFNLNNFQVTVIINELRNMLYVQQVGTSDLYRFHDLFCSAQRNLLSKDEVIRFDRLIIEFYKSKKNETTELNAIIEPFFHLQFVDSKEAFAYFEAIYKPILDRDNKTLSAILISQIDLDIVESVTIKNWFKLRIGGYYRQFHQYQQAIQIFNEVLVDNKDKDKKLEAFVLNNLGICFLFVNQLDIAKDYFKKSIEICEELGLEEIKGYNLNNLGIYHDYKGHFNEAIKYYFRAFNLYKKINITGIRIGNVFKNYGTLLLNNNKIEVALSLLRYAELEYFTDGDIVNAAHSKLMQIRCMLYKSDYKIAYKEMKKNSGIEDIFKIMGLEDDQLQLHFLYSLVYFYSGDYVKSLGAIIYILLKSLKSFRNLVSHNISHLIKFLVLTSNHKNMPILLQSLEDANEISENTKKQVFDYISNQYKINWLIQDPSSIIHTPNCLRFRKGNYFELVKLIPSSELLHNFNIKTCECVRN